MPPQKHESGGRTRRLQFVVAKEVARLDEQLSRLSGHRAEMGRAGQPGKAPQRLAGETLAAVGGVSIRAAGLDGDTCDIADALITSISAQMTSGYDLVTVPSGSEFIDLMSDVIRVRYPGAGVWDLPLSLHEFGHFLVTHLPRSPEPSVSTIVEQERAERPYRGFFAEELWADTFATYAGGPAYALSALERFDVVRPDDDEKPSHPSPMKRARDPPDPAPLAGRLGAQGPGCRKPRREHCVLGTALARPASCFGMGGRAGLGGCEER